MHRFAIFAFFALACLVPQAHAARYPGTFNDAETAELDKLSAYLNGIHTLKSNFVQLGPQGELAQGEFDLAKPGRLRFSYNPPSPIVIVATGGDIYVKNVRLNTVDRSSLADTPLDLLLNQDIDLRHDPMITGIEQQPGALILHARAATTKNQSNITLVFSYPAIELRQWMVKDNQGGVTTVALTGLQTGAALPDALFAAPQKDPAKAK
ncbi:MAG TPA: outer-membrane lipoprotein carrier protein LolA [Rhizomicrobium sp.]|jgi:outer membrane lipoprotein-sorting protein|nr:outer-membrane lipoprotein carrier protein LolA [Rhizomicrobium sp.]